MSQDSQISEKSVEFIKEKRFKMRESMKGLVVRNRKFSHHDFWNGAEQTDQFNEIFVRTRSRTLTLNQSFDMGQKSLEQKNQFQQLYNLGPKVGDGGQATVYQCTQKQTQQKFAVKITSASSQEIISVVQHTYKMLCSLNHQNILIPKKLIVNDQSMTCWMITQLLDYSNLKKFIKTAKSVEISEYQISSIICKILKALKYLHQKNICHRDIKPQNILYNNQTGQLKIIDFQISKIKKIEESELNMWTDTGSLFYRAPQSFFSGYSKEVDIWSVGIIMFQLFAGKVPFYNSDLNKTKKLIIENQVNLNQLKISEVAKSLLQGLLTKDPSKRLNAQQALIHEFFKICDKQRKQSSDTDQDDCQVFKNYYRKLSQKLKSQNCQQITQVYSQFQLQELTFCQKQQY